MILGHGIDIVDVKRIGNVYKKFGDNFLKKILSNSERANIPVKQSEIILFLAKHWCVKEAVSKAVGCGLVNGSTLHFKDIVLSHDRLNKPIIVLTEQLYNNVIKVHDLSLKKQKDIMFHISISDEKNTIIASSILEIR